MHFYIIDSIAVIAQNTGEAVKTVIEGVADVKGVVNVVDGMVKSITGMAKNIRRGMTETTTNLSR